MKNARLWRWRVDPAEADRLYLVLSGNAYVDPAINSRVDAVIKDVLARGPNGCPCPSSPQRQFGESGCAQHPGRAGRTLRLP